MQRSFGKELMAGAAGTAILLTITAAASGTALSLHVSRGHAPFTVNSATKVANVNASLPGGISAGGFVQGGGHMATAQVELKVGRSATLLRLASYGRFLARCVSGPLAELQFTPARHRVHLWLQDLVGTSSQVSEQNLSPGSSLGIEAGAAEQIEFTIQNASSSRLNTHVATVQAVEKAINHVCDFAVTAYAGP